MGKARSLVTALLVLLALVRVANAEQTLRWETTIDSAKRTAGQTNRLVLIVFTAPWCQACRVMESEVLSQPGVNAALEMHYVPVKVNVEYFPAAARQYGITALPTTVVIAPTSQGEVLDSIRGRMAATAYLARLDQVAVDAKRRGIGVPAQIAGTPAPAAAQRANPPATPAASVRPGSPADSDDRYANVPDRSAPPSPVSSAPPMAASSAIPMAASTLPPVATAAAPVAAMTPSGGSNAVPPPMQQSVAAANSLRPAAPPTSPLGPMTPPAVPSVAGPVTPSAPAVGNPPLGLDGFCPVRLTERSVWTPGDRRWGAIHRGRTYLFVGPEEQRAFLADPDRFAPVNSGLDVVVALEQGRSVVGARAHGVFFGGKIYLFADEGSLEKFSKNPRYYADRAIQAARAPSEQSPQVR